MGNLLERIRKFVAATPGLTETAFGIRVVGDPCFVFDLDRPVKPRVPRANTVNWVELWIETAENGRFLDAADRKKFMGNKPAASS
jgi:hypothetical protein